MYWDLFYKYMQYSGDTTHLSFVDSNIQLATLGNNDFLDGANPFIELAGRWNDDILWWAIAVTTAAETFGKDAIVAKDNVQAGMNPTYFTLANTTFHQAWNQWDNACGGGIYWSRARSSGRDPNLKSTITNVQEMEVGARLYAMTKVEDYKTKVDQLLAWLKTSGIIAKDYTVYDGVRSTSCGTVSPEIYSYHYGELFAALASMYQTTKTQSYLDEANKLFTAFKRLFVDANTNIISIEPFCPAPSCRSPSGFLFPVYRGLGELYVASNDESIRTQIAAIVRASAANNFKGCDSNWYCMRNMDPSVGSTLLNGNKCERSV
ncbi:glycoside hydrolase [Obelidium mucronatum]|nr:glycoside hydrolase [Obelidium mucronatum]